MKNVPTFKEIYKLMNKSSLEMTYGLSFIYSIIFGFIFYEIGVHDYDDMVKMFSEIREVITIIVILVVVVIFNYSFCVMGIYLMTTSFVLSKRYGRLLIVLFGVIFLLSVFHVLPVGEIKENYRWFSNLTIRIFQGLTLVSMVVISYGVIQGLVLYIIGRKGDE
jgi:hypothetical protein